MISKPIGPTAHVAIGYDFVTLQLLAPRLFAPLRADRGGADTVLPVRRVPGRSERLDRQPARNEAPDFAPRSRPTGGAVRPRSAPAPVAHRRAPAAERPPVRPPVLRHRRRQILPHRLQGLRASGSPWGPPARGQLRRGGPRPVSLRRSVPAANPLLPPAESALCVTFCRPSGVARPGDGDRLRYPYPRLRGLRPAMAVHRVQSSTFRPGTLTKSRTFAVNTV